MTTDTADVADVHRRDETLMAVTTSVAAVATAWAAFQATTWDGRCAFALVRADRQRELSTEARLEGDQQIAVDVNLFVEWAVAYADGRQERAAFLHDRFPPQLRHPLDAWLATRPRENREAPPHPFAMSEYRIEPHERALALSRDADTSIAERQQANRISDTYLLHTVILATVILLVSLSVRLRHAAPRRAMLVLGCVGLVATLVTLALSPIAWIG
jgi:hypothetical protein